MPYETTSQRRRDFFGVSFTALCGGALALNLVLILALLALIGWEGGRYFWQKDLLEVELTDCRKVLGEVHATEQIAAHRAQDGVARDRLQLRAGNRDFPGLEAEATGELARHGWAPDYVAVRKQSDLQFPGAEDRALVVLGAARLGETRLIDNLETCLT